VRCQLFFFCNRLFLFHPPLRWVVVSPGGLPPPPSARTQTGFSISPDFFFLSLCRQRLLRTSEIENTASLPLFFGPAGSNSPRSGPDPKNQGNPFFSASSPPCFRKPCFFSLVEERGKLIWAVQFLFVVKAFLVMPKNLSQIAQSFAVPPPHSPRNFGDVRSLVL